MACRGVEAGISADLPPGWGLATPLPSGSPTTIGELVRPLAHGDQMDRTFCATDADAKVVVCWGKWVQKWRVYTVRDGEQGPDECFGRHECGAAVKEALDRVWAHADAST